MLAAQDEQLPDLTPILDDLYIGNLASARALHEHPELGITHVLSVCPEHPEEQETHEGVTTSPDAPSPSVARPLHLCIPVQDSENEDILSHLPKAVNFICTAFDGDLSSSLFSENDNLSEECKAGSSSVRATTTDTPKKHKVLVHCVMGISRSSTVVCAYLMATRDLSLGAALMFLRKRRPLVHPNFGFRRQLVVFAENGFFRNWTRPIRTHPAWTTWQKKKKKEVARYLARVEDMVELDLEDPDGSRLSLIEDFPTDALEAASLLNEAEATHFLTISPTSMPPLPPSAPFSSLSPSSSPVMRPACRSHIPAALSMTPTISASTSDSPVSSPISSRSSSFSGGSRFSLASSLPSTAATSVQSLFPPTSAKAAQDASAVEFEEAEDDTEPTFLDVAGVKHYHLPISGPSSVDMLVKMNEGASFVQTSLQTYGTECENPPPSFSTPTIKPHVLIHSTIESRGVIVACAYLMQARGKRPSQAYSIVEKALPLFNPTKSFLKQLELYHDCQYHPTRDHPLIRAATSAENVPLKNGLSSIHPSIAKLREEGLPSSEEADAFDADSDRDGHVLRKALGTPMRTGSFSSNYVLTPAHSRKPSMSHHSSSGPSAGLGLGLMRRTSSVLNSSMVRRTNSGSSPIVKGVDVEKLLQKCEGVGDPGFSFDVEAFRGALKGIAETRHKEGLS